MAMASGTRGSRSRTPAAGRPALLPSLFHESHWASWLWSGKFNHTNQCKINHYHLLGTVHITWTILTISLAPSPFLSASGWSGSKLTVQVTLSCHSLRWGDPDSLDLVVWLCSKASQPAAIQLFHFPLNHLMFQESHSRLHTKNPTKL